MCLSLTAIAKGEALVTRTFIAIELPDESRAALTRQRARLARVLPEIRWVEPATWHITLAFLGELDDKTLVAATDAARSAAREGRPCDVRIEGLGTFGSRRAPRVVWAGVGGEVAQLRALHARLASALADHGFAPGARPFAPHLTLARVKSPLQADALERLRAEEEAAAGHELAAWRATQLSVMKSQLLQRGAQYSCLHAFPLGGQPCTGRDGCR